jgi:uncharacterized Fe-S cluster protein YjdI
MSDAPRITPTENGPYEVQGCRRLTRMGDGTEYPLEETVWLCRCGGSRDKPFCDGTHATNGFRGAKSTDRVPDQRDDYVGRGITIHDNRGICAHSARCTDSLEAVFKLREEPWIDPDGVAAGEIVAVVEQCPSGALSYSVDGVEHRDRAREPEILVVPNGPYAVRGGDRHSIGTVDHSPDRLTHSTRASHTNTNVVDGSAPRG